MYGSRSVGSVGSMEALAGRVFYFSDSQHDRNTCDAFLFRGLSIK